MIDVIKNIGHFSFRLPDELSGLDGKNRAVMLDDVVSILEQYQRKQPKTDWIPCEERLPKKEGQYLVTTVGFFQNVVSTVYFDSEMWHSISKVLAWQPLPTPYKKEGAENE